MSRSRTPCANASMPARISPLVSSRSKMCAVIAQALLVRLVDDGAVDFRRELLVLAVAGVDPDLHDVDLVRRELLHRLAAFLLGVDPVRHRQASRLGHGDAAPGAEEARGAGDGLAADVEQLVVVHAEAERGAHAEIGALPQVAHDRFARRAQMDVGVDQHRHHGLAGEAHARRARGTFTSAARPAATIRAPSTRSVAFSIGAPPSPTMRRAPSNAVTPVWARAGEAKTATKGKGGCSKSGDVHAAHRSLHGESGRPYFSASRRGRRGGRPACGVIGELMPGGH